jgi:hypothetical protein
MMKQTWDLIDLTQSAPESEEARQARRQLRGNLQELAALMETERDTILEDFGESLGYNESEQQQFAEYVNHVVDMTSMSGFRRRGRGRPPREASGTGD